MERREGIPAFTKSRLINYAELLQEIAQEYQEEKKEEETEEIEEKYISRAALLAKEQDRQSRKIFARFVMDTAGQIEKLATMQLIQSTPYVRQEKKICKILKDEGICVLDYYRTSNRNGFLEIGMVLRAEDNCYFEVMEIAALLSEVTRKNMLPGSGQAYIHNEPVAVCFHQEPVYHIFGGFAKATKEEEEVSGDNYILREFGDGTYLAAIADGMGSGELAGMDSEKTLSLVEKYIESELTVPDCIRACNELFYMDREQERTVSLDIMELNQYTGECHFYKSGGAPSYYIRNGKIHEISADKYPLGLAATCSVSDQVLYLEAGDMVIMLSDGVAEEFYENPQMLQIGIEKLKTENPTDIATGILELAVSAQGRVQDDMTVLVVMLYQEE